MISEVNGWSTSHRPFPPPRSEWVMYQEWHDLLFAHWPVDAAVLRPLIPSCLPIDQHGGTGWVGITPFRIVGARARLLPAIPFVSDFPELNVRTYVTVDDKPGVYFFSLDAGSQIAVAGARVAFHLPYYLAEMSVEEDGPWINYYSLRTDPDSSPAEFRGVYRPVGEVFEAKRGSLEFFLTERYCLYTVDESGNLIRCDIHHPAWPLQAAEAEIRTNTMAEGKGIVLPDLAPILHFAPRQPTVIWPPENLGPCQSSVSA